MKNKADTSALEATLRRELDQFDRLHDDLRLSIEGQDYVRADKVCRQISQLLHMIQADVHSARHV
ncbi:hypothetical protein SAMN05421823_101465 [Catalinimonas alkaloidigena]|uniref:Uncharacterized protein n=1 Tax=Catalinimonas alkaloidigena TaxID=1075417 RepID=A0A1G8XT01_9BACT|nr:hypothetical protein [Catalinimonas alkaloidigena]SDJ93617.1 hypothetical protein SAMN05421823_101465 [Catalinimonas alkaloidigena]